MGIKILFHVLYSSPSYEAPAAPSYEAPAAPSYEAPAAPSYEAPAAPSYEAPAAPSYEAPAPSYSPPSPSYETEQSYSPPATYEEPSYESPEPSYGSGGGSSGFADFSNFPKPNFPDFSFPSFDFDFKKINSKIFFLSVTEGQFHLHRPLSGSNWPNKDAIYDKLLHFYDLRGPPLTNPQTPRGYMDPQLRTYGQWFVATR